MGKFYNAIKKKDHPTSDADEASDGTRVLPSDESIPESEAFSYSKEPEEKNKAIGADDPPGKTIRVDHDGHKKWRKKRKRRQEADSRGHLIAYHQPFSFESEQFKVVRTKLLFPDSGERCRSIMISSAMPGEGKTFVAANLAISLAQTINEYVLLVDCDLRNPSIGKHFGLKGATGLSDYLSTDMDLSQALVKTEIPKLSLLAAGTRSQNPSELLSSSRMANLLDEIKSRYQDRFVIIDSPPPNLIAEANAIAKQVDGILLVVRYAKTGRETVKNLIQMVGKEKIIGAIINRCNPSAFSYGRYRGAGSYGKYYARHGTRLD